MIMLKEIYAKIKALLTKQSPRLIDEFKQMEKETEAKIEKVETEVVEKIKKKTRKK